MLPMLDLLCTILKYCSILTLARLTSTAFGWEFGVSKQYLRLLELLFKLGQKRIEKVESENKLLLINSIDVVQEEDEDGYLSADSDSGGASNAQSCEQDCDAKKGVVDQQRPFSGLHEEEDCDHSKERCRRKIGSVQPPPPPLIVAQKLRRISTPDGPPVFLLDNDDDDEDDYGYANNYKQNTFHLDDSCKLVVKGVSAIIDDQVTKRFTQEELKTWNLLTRTNAKNYQFMSRSLGLYWFFGVVVRYAILMPLRIMFTLAGFGWLICTMTLVGLLPVGWRAGPYRLLSLMSFRMLSCGITSRLEFHNRQYRAKNGDICVANHTSPLDVVLLACDNCYALVGQRHGGLIGVLEYALSRATNHVWFDRGEMRDRQFVTKRLKEHVNSKSNLPVLIFPEGTCINNSAVMMFRKGSFETTDRVCPVAIKYDPRFGDPFWNSSKQTYLEYLLLMMSSWAIKCDVWYLPPMDRLPGESSAEFAGRVKAEIARQGGLVDLNWDGQLKRSAPKEVWKHQQQEDFVKRLRLEQ